MFGRRADGRAIRGSDPIVNLTPYLMPTRADSQVATRVDLDFDAMTRYIRKKREEGRTISYMGLILAAYVRTASQFPEINRFIMNKKLYARNHLCVSFVTLKKNDTDDIDESLVKLNFNPESTVFEISEQLEAAIEVSREPRNKNRTDVFAHTLLAVPLFPNIVVGLVRLLDRYGLMPGFVYKASPFHTSLFISNMASIGMGYIYHHIYNFGTTSIFVSMGKTEQVLHANADGTCKSRRIMPLGVVIDERIASGALYGKAFAFLRSCLAKPEILEERPENVRLEIPLRVSSVPGGQINSFDNKA